MQIKTVAGVIILGRFTMYNTKAGWTEQIKRNQISIARLYESSLAGGKNVSCLQARLRN